MHNRITLSCTDSVLDTQIPTVDVVSIGTRPFAPREGSGSETTVDVRAQTAAPPIHAQSIAIIYDSRPRRDASCHERTLFDLAFDKAGIKMFC